MLQVEQIQAEYKVRALQFHPDKNPDDAEAEARFQELQVRLLDMIWCGSHKWLPFKYSEHILQHLDL